MRLVALGLPSVALLVAGCTTIEPSQNLGEEASSRLLVGIVQVRTQEQPGQLVGRQTKVLGADLSRERILIGIASDTKFVADPAQCQVVIVIKRKSDLAAAQNLVNQFKGGNACIADLAPY